MATESKLEFDTIGMQITASIPLELMSSRDKCNLFGKLAELLGAWTEVDDEAMGQIIRNVNKHW